MHFVDSMVHRNTACISYSSCQWTKIVFAGHQTQTARIVLTAQLLISFLWHTSFILTNPEAGKWTLCTFTLPSFPSPCSFSLPCMQAINALNICGWRMTMTIKMLAQQDVYKALTVQFNFYQGNILTFFLTYFLIFVFSLVVIWLARVSIAIGYYCNMGRYINVLAASHISVTCKQISQGLVISSKLCENERPTKRHC